MIYVNRYEDQIEFTDYDDAVVMKGFEYLRYGYDDDYNISMVDPSGGPYIEVGHNLKYLFNDSKDRIVKSITIYDSYIEFKL